MTSKVLRVFQRIEVADKSAPTKRWSSHSIWLRPGNVARRGPIPWFAASHDEFRIVLDGRCVWIW